MVRLQIWCKMRDIWIAPDFLTAGFPPKKHVSRKGCRCPFAIHFGNSTNEISEVLALKNYFTSSDPHHDMLGGGCQVRVVRVSIPCYLPPRNSFLLFRTSHLLRPTHQENTWQTYLKTAATAHAQTCQNMSGYDLSNISMKQKSNMSVDLLKQGQKFLRQQRRMLKSQMHWQCVTRSILCTKHAKSCQDTTCQHISRINRRHQTCQ